MIQFGIKGRANGDSILIQSPWQRAETTWLYIFLPWKGSSPPVSHPVRDKNTHPPSPGPKVGGFCEGSPLKCPQNLYHFSPANKYHSAAVPWLRLHVKCYKLLSEGRKWSNTTSSGQAKEAAGAPQSLLLMHTLRAPQVVPRGQAYKKFT